MSESPKSLGGALLEARAIAKRFGGNHAVKGMDLTVRAGELVGLIGPNGAGKSTLFNILAGSLKADSGRVFFEGRDITGFSAHRIARLGIARTFQQARPIARMTVLENVMLAPANQPGEQMGQAIFSQRWGRREGEIRTRAMEELRFVDLEQLAHAYAGTLSGGQKKLLELARAAVSDPRLLLLDEPLAGVNPTLARRIMEKIKALQTERRITCLLVEHDIASVFRYSDRIVVMAEGRMLAEGSAEEIKANESVLDAYLGRSA
ncbi:MAG: ABC transporter ATP-binding protein [Thermoplasmatota archaeon]